jgi:hypothetical protein
MIARKESFPVQVAKATVGAMLVIGYIAMTGCSSSDVFNEGTAIQAAAGHKLDFQSEQVSLTHGMLTCAVENRLFNAPAYSGIRNLAKLTDKGRELGFSDDVSVDEPGYTLPYTQIRGSFPVEFQKVVRIRDVQLGEKRVEAKAGVRIAHECFPQPLLLMGIRNGVIAQNNPAAFEFDQYGTEWRLMSIVH